MTRASLGDNIQGGEVLLPVRGHYISLTLLAALLLNLVPMPGWASWVWPDFVALMIVYWGTFQPHRLGLLPAWALGLVMDVSDASLFGQHALAYVALAHVAVFLHRRVQMFSLPYQMAHVAAMLLAQQFIQLLVRLVAGAGFPGVALFAASLTAAALWPLAVLLLTLPLRRRAAADDV
jgi:rod shape-determining protein MreD